jgi:hypothetical protein
MTGVAWFRSDRDMPILDTSWHPHARCRGLGRANDDYWFVLPVTHNRVKPHSHPKIRAALQLCEGCPVRLLCWDQAVNDQHAEGVWGGAYWPHEKAARVELIAHAGPHVAGPDGDAP